MSPNRKMRALFVAAVAASLAAPAHAEGMIRNPDWIQKPDGHQMAWAYPPMASSLIIEGATQLACGVTAEGLLRDCKVATETPSGLGFAAASLTLTSYFRMSPKMVDGRGVAGGEVRIPLNFKLSDPPSSASPGPPTSARALQIARELVAAEGLHDSLASTFSAESPTFSDWRRPDLDPALVSAGHEALATAFEAEFPAWSEATARAYASQFTADQLSARLVFVQRPGGQALARKQGDLNALMSPIGWAAFQVGMTLGRKSFCETHACVRDATAPATPEPDWIETPSRDQLYGAIPVLARPLKLAGEVKLHCEVSTIGALSGCRAAYETPQGFGFTDAAIRLSKYYRARPPAPGVSSPAVDVTIRFPEFPTQVPPLPKTPPLDEAPSEARKALARDVISANGFTTLLALQTARTMKDFDAIPSPGVDAKTRAETLDALSKGMTAAGFVWQAARIKHYAGLFSEAELKDMLDWERSPAAKAFRDQQPGSAEAEIARGKYFLLRIGAQAGRIFCARRDCAAFTKAEAPPPRP